MNDPNEPSDEFQFHDDHHRDLAGLSGIEQKLEQFKPRRPKLDFAAIEQSASDVKANIPLTATVLQGGKYRSISHLAGPVAASWICGVVVGALCVFYAMPSASNPTVFNKTAEVPILEPDNSPAKLDSAAKLAGSERTEQSNALDEGGTLRLTGRYVKVNEWMNPSDFTRKRVDRIPASSGVAEVTNAMFDANFPQYTPPPPMTQAEFMRELLTESKQVVH